MSSHSSLTPRGQPHNSQFSDVSSPGVDSVPSHHTHSSRSTTVNGRHDVTSTSRLPEQHHGVLVLSGAIRCYVPLYSGFTITTEGGLQSELGLSYVTMTHLTNHIMQCLPLPSAHCHHINRETVSHITHNSTEQQAYNKPTA